ncbi:MAG: MoaD/ThiS family protein [Elusimicrobia bacterium]|nr:MoaD/ThiS family protein [Elusimicrobiota bacterium]
MPKVTVMIYTTLRARLGISKTDIHGSTVAEIINKLKEIKKPEVERALLDENGKVRNYFVLTLNSEILDNKKISDRQVKEGDVLHIFPPISGG